MIDLAGIADALATQETLVGVLAIALLFGAILASVSVRKNPIEPQTVEAEGKRWILVDGSNVMHWQDNTPMLAPLLQVVSTLKAQGFTPGVVFDANAGYKLAGRFLNDGDLARMLDLPRDQVLVVPKGSQADPFLLETARDYKAAIVTNDRFRDWAEAYPDVVQPNGLIRGGVRDAKVWLGQGPRAVGRQGRAKAGR